MRYGNQLLVVLCYVLAVPYSCKTTYERTPESETKDYTNQTYKSSSWYKELRDDSRLKPFAQYLDQYSKSSFQAVQNKNYLFFAYNRATKTSKPIRNPELYVKADNETIMFKFSKNSIYTYESEIDTKYEFAKAKGVTMRIRVFLEGKYESTDAIDYFVEKVLFDRKDANNNVKRFVAMQQKANQFLLNITQNEEEYTRKHLLDTGLQKEEVDKELIKNYIYGGLAAVVAIAATVLLAVFARLAAKDPGTGGLAMVVAAAIAVLIIFPGRYALSSVGNILGSTPERNYLQQKEDTLRKVFKQGISQ